MKSDKMSADERKKLALRENLKKRKSQIRELKKGDGDTLMPRQNGFTVNVAEADKFDAD